MTEISPGQPAFDKDNTYEQLLLILYIANHLYGATVCHTPSSEGWGGGGRGGGSSNQQTNKQTNKQINK